MHEEYTLKIMITPTHSPCETCSLDCSLQEKQDGVCEKLNEFNNKIIAKEYDYDKAVDIMAKTLCKLTGEGECRKSCGKCNIKRVENDIEKIFPQIKRFFTSRAVAALKALLGV